MTTSDAGEGLVDAESRLAERMDERRQEKQSNRGVFLSGDPERNRELESCRLARVELQRQLEMTVHKVRRAQLSDALTELESRMAKLSV
jgi:hypothetical protein